LFAQPTASLISSTKPSQLKTVLICDDEQDILLTYAAILREDYLVITTRSGKECVDTCTQHKNSGQKIHLILLDFKLGDMNGEQVSKLIMTLNGTKIILISAYELDSPLVEELLKNNIIVEFLSKPIHMEALKEAVSKVIS